MSYAETLRSIGEALDDLRVETFKLLREGNDYLVRAKTETIDGKHRNLQSTDLERFRGRYPELRFSPEDLARLESEGRTKRREPEGVPQPNSLTNILRAVGTYMDLKGNSLLTISKEGAQWVVIRYKSDIGGICTEKVEISSLYAMFVRLYSKRVEAPAGDQGSNL
ncbi:MAG: hypothetical protein E6J89_04235 [Deltaproteobacteria bacterium]|nr:MAG: hypothetical protein E6J89_04235 [Deltaproteobacteria bacterium]